MKSKHLGLWVMMVVSLHGMMGLQAFAADIYKVFTVESMNTEAGWTGGKVPDSGDYAVFNGANGTTGNFLLEDNLLIGGMKFGWVSVQPNTFNGTYTLSIGAGGIPSVDRGTASPIVFNNPVFLAASQRWISLNSVQMFFNNDFGAAEGTVLEFDSLPNRQKGSLYLAASNSFAGRILISVGTLNLSTPVSSLCSGDVQLRDQLQVNSTTNEMSESIRGRGVFMEGGSLIVSGGQITNTIDRFTSSLTLLEGINDVSCRPSSGYGAQLAFADIDRAVGGGVVILHGNYIGQALYPAVNKANILFDTPLA